MFYNIHGEEISEENIVNELIEKYNTLHDENKTLITDFNEGSEIRTLLEVLSHLGYNIMEEMDNMTKQHYVSTAENEFLDLIGENYKIQREEGSFASGLVRFSLVDPTESVINTEQLIPAGAIVSTVDSENEVIMSYETQTDGIIGIGESYTYVEVMAIIEGADGNCRANTITQLDQWSGNEALSVTNEEAFTNGADFEDDEMYRDRLLEYIQADNFGSRGYYENLLLNIPNVHDIKPYTGNTELVSYYINTNNSDNNHTALLDAIELFSQPDTCVLGHTWFFKFPAEVTLNITVDINGDCGLTEDEVKDIIGTYFVGGDCQLFPFSFAGFDMGASFDTDMIIKDLKNLDSRITDLSVTINVDELADNEALVIGNIGVNYV